MHHGGDFVIDPLPNLLFTRDSSFWIGPRVAITSLALPARVRETSLTDLIYAHHPRFLGVRRAYESRSAPVEGGDVLLLARVWSRSGWGSAPRRPGRRRWRAACSTTTSRTPCSPFRSRRSVRRCISTRCARWSTSTRRDVPNIVDSLSAFTIHRNGDGGVTIDDAVPFVEAAANAMQIDKLRVIATGWTR